jgi:putative acetyltransferase
MATTSAHSAVLVRPSTTPADVSAFRTLCLEYAKTLEYTGECRSLEVQCFDTEMATLPGAYAPPRGEILLAWDGLDPVGCVALRPLSDGICEMKRMYVRPAGRGKGVGRLLATALIDAARARGYRAMRLDTGATMVHAAALYRSLGFREIPAYNRDPVPGTMWFELTL